MTTMRSAILAAVLLIGLSACGSDDDTQAGPTDESPQTDQDDGQSTDAPDPDSGDDPSGGGAASGTVTVSDGTEYVLAVSSCETTDTDPVGFPFPNSFDLQGKSSDGFGFYIASVGLNEEGDIQTGYLEGDYDENGQNAGIIYTADASTLEFTVDGRDVSGTVGLRAIGPAGPHGEETEATFVFSC